MLLNSFLILFEINAADVSMKADCESDKYMVYRSNIALSSYYETQSQSTCSYSANCPD